MVGWLGRLANQRHLCRIRNEVLPGRSFIQIQSKVLTSRSHHEQEDVLAHVGGHEEDLLVGTLWQCVHLRYELILAIKQPHNQDCACSLHIAHHGRVLLAVVLTPMTRVEAVEVVVAHLLPLFIALLGFHVGHHVVRVDVLLSYLQSPQMLLLGQPVLVVGEFFDVADVVSHGLKDVFDSAPLLLLVVADQVVVDNNRGVHSLKLLHLINIFKFSLKITIMELLTELLYCL